MLQDEDDHQAKGVPQRPGKGVPAVISEGIADLSKNHTAIPDEFSDIVKTPPPLPLKAAPYETAEFDRIPHPDWPLPETQAVEVTTDPVTPSAAEFEEEREHPESV